MLLCPDCGEAFEDAAAPWRCRCGGAFDYVYGDGGGTLRRNRVDAGERSLWRYRAALPPVPESCLTTMGEGGTPLVPGRLGGRGVLFKLDFLCPTGSYKDRGSAVLVSKLREAGHNRIHDDSSGNAGSSLAAYAARGGIACDIYLPESASAGKQVQIGLFGARLVRVPGLRQAAAQAALDAAAAYDAGAGGSFYASHNYSPFFLEGMKTVAFELWEQLGFQAPGAVLAPVGYGSILLGLYEGFAALARAGQIDRLPRLVGVQAEPCAPLYAAWRAGAADVTPVEAGPTAAEGIACARPVRGRRLLQAVRESGGACLTVGEDEIWAALDELARQGIFVEPTSAVVPAAFARISRRGTSGGAEAGERRPADADPLAGVDGPVVLYLSGTGLKAVDKLLAHRDGGAPPR